MLAKKKGLTLSWPIPNHMALETPQRLALGHDKRAPGEVVRIYSELIKWSDYLRITSNIKTLEAFQTFKLKVISNHRATPPLSDEDTRESEYFLFYRWVVHPEKSPFPTHCPSFLPALLFRHMLRFKLSACVTKVQRPCSGLERNEGLLFFQCAIYTPV